MALPGLQQGSYDALYQGLVDALLSSQLLASTGAWLHLPQHSVQLSSAEQTLAEKLLPAITAGRYDPPWVRDLARDHAAGEELVRQLLKSFRARASCSRSSRICSIHRRAWMSSPPWLPTSPAGTPEEVEASAFRDATGLGRKRAIQILEFFDRTGYTRRVRDAHLLRPDVHWNSTPR
jgi:selenocysteine-specific elongation factor